MARATALSEVASTGAVVPSVDATAVPICGIWVGAALMIGGATMRWMTLRVSGSATFSLAGLDRADATWRIADIPDGWFVVVAAVVALVAAVLFSTALPRRVLPIMSAAAGLVALAACLAAWFDFAGQRDDLVAAEETATRFAHLDLGIGLVSSFGGALLVVAGSVWLVFVTTRRRAVALPTR